MQHLHGIIVDFSHTADNSKAGKEKSTEKVDGIVVLIMASDRAVMRGNGTAEESVYEKRGLLIF